MWRERSWSLFPQIQATNLPLAPVLILPDFNVKVKSLSPVRLFATLWTVANQAPPSKGFSRQEYWHGLPFPSPGDLPHPGIKPRPSALQADSLPSEPPGKLLPGSLDWSDKYPVENMTWMFRVSYSVFAQSVWKLSMCLWLHTASIRLNFSESSTVRV